MVMVMVVAMVVVVVAVVVAMVEAVVMVVDVQPSGQVLLQTCNTISHVPRLLVGNGVLAISHEEVRCAKPG